MRPQWTYWERGEMTPIRVATLIGALLLTACGSHRQPLERIESAATGPRDYHEVATSKPMATSVPEIFDTGPDIRAKMIELIESASDYILIDSFLVSSDSATSAVMEALKRKRRDGVRIHVLADSSTRYADGGKAGYRFLEEAGISTVEYNPMRIYKLVVAPIMLKRDHRKFWIVDGKVLFLGGANLFGTSLTRPEDGGNRDFMVAVESAEAIESMVESFVATWNLYSSRPLDKASFSVRADRVGETTLWLSDQNKHAGRRQIIGKMFDGLFAVAQEEVWLIQPYTFVTPELIGHIREMTRRGVAVNVMLSGDVHAQRFRYASLFGCKNIIEAGGKVWLFQSGQGALHAKAILVDGRWASVGSANLNFRSYHLSKEANLVFGDPVSVGKVGDIIEELRGNCRPIDLEESMGYRGAKYRLGWLLMQMAG
ncbi:MAG: cardiolipin synthase [Verrucomicrobiales bacterium]|jgi:cardiolipin synthase